MRPHVITQTTATVLFVEFRLVQLPFAMFYCLYLQLDIVFIYAQSHLRYVYV